MPPPVLASTATHALVHGCSRGLGLEFVNQLLQRPSCHVYAACRTPSPPLLALSTQHPNLTVLRMDAADEHSVADAVAAVSQAAPHLNMLINAVGVLHVPGQMMPETSYSRVTPAHLDMCFQANTYAPFLVGQAFYPLLVAAATNGAADAQRPAVLASLSARVGSLADNGLGGWYSYRASKAALNMLYKCLAIEGQRKRHMVTTMLLHPGTVDTDLSVPFQKLFTRERAVEQLLGIIEGATLADNGRFVAWDGTDIPW